MTTRTVSITWPTNQLVNINHERNLHHHARARLVKPIRAAFHNAAQDLDPLTGPVTITATFQWANDQIRDTANWYPTAKAAVDGMVDAGIIPRDDDRTVKNTTIGPTQPAQPALKGNARITVTISQCQDGESDNGDKMEARETAPRRCVNTVNPGGLTTTSLRRA